MAVAVLERFTALRVKPSRSTSFGLAVAGSAVLAAAVTSAAPTQLPLLDKLYVAGLAAK